MQRLVILAAMGLFALAGSAAHAGFIQGFQTSGNIGLEVAADAAGNGGLVSGTLTLSQNMPGPILKATLYANDWSGGPVSGGNLDLTFAGSSAGTTTPF